MSKIDIRTLTCGVRVVMEKIDYVQSAAFGVWVKAGACDENKQNARLRINGNGHCSLNVLIASRRSHRV